MESLGERSGLVNDSAVSKKVNEFRRIYQYYLDKTAPHPDYRWVGTLILALIYGIRVYFLQGFYVITYTLGIYFVNLLMEFLSPLVVPKLEPFNGPVLPTKDSDEFKPFIRRLPEFKFWYYDFPLAHFFWHSITKAFCIALLVTFFSMFDVPAYWPILLVYWLLLFVFTMKRQIAHMIKYRYIPFSLGKQRYGGKKQAASSSSYRAD